MSNNLDKLEIRISGREKTIPKDKRSVYFRDYSRIIHSSFFRKLQGKTQVYPNLHTNIRTRLSHSLEVSQIAESICIQYFLDYNYVDMDVVKSLCLVHD